MEKKEKAFKMKDEVSKKERECVKSIVECIVSESEKSCNKTINDITKLIESIESYMRENDRNLLELKIIDQGDFRSIASFLHGKKESIQLLQNQIYPILRSKETKKVTIEESGFKEGKSVFQITDAETGDALISDIPLDEAYEIIGNKKWKVEKE